MSHALGRIIVQAENEEDAFDQAEDALMMIAGEGKDYDGGETLQKSDAFMRNDTEQPIIEVCGKFGSTKCDRCKDRFKCYTRKTVDVVQVEFDRMKTDFLIHMAKIRRAVRSKTNEQLFEDARFRWHCHDVGGHDGYGSLLFDSDGSCIINSKELKSAMKPQEGLKVYVVTVDLHY